MTEKSLSGKESKGKLHRKLGILENEKILVSKLKNILQSQGNLND